MNKPAPVRKVYFIKATTFDLQTEEPEDVREINFSTSGGREFLEKLIFSCINNGKGVAIELDRKEVEPINIDDRARYGRTTAAIR